METSYIDLEFCARYGLKHSRGDSALAQQIAAFKYRQLVGRGLIAEEISGIEDIIYGHGESTVAKAYVI